MQKSMRKGQEMSCFLETIKKGTQDKRLIAYNFVVGQLKKQNGGLYFLIGNNLLFCTFIFIAIIVTSTISSDKINSFFSIAFDQTQFGFISVKYVIKLVIIVALFFMFIASSLLFLIISYGKGRIQINDHYFSCFALVIITLNFIAFCYILFSYFFKNNYENKNKILKIRFKINNMTVRDNLLLSYITAISLLLLAVQEYNFGGTVGLCYVPLMGISFVKGFRCGGLAGVVVALLAILFIPSSQLLSPGSYLLDYFLPLTTPAFVAFFTFKITAEKTIFNYINYFFHCLIVVTLVYIWQVLSGYFIWLPSRSSTSLLTALIYNFVHNYLLTCPVLLCLTPKIYRTLSVYYGNFIILSANNK